MIQTYYHHADSVSAQHHQRTKRVLQLLKTIDPEKTPVFEIGAGNGRTAIELSAAGYSVRGIEPSPEGVEIARAHHCDIEAGSAYDDLAKSYGTYDVVLSLEVIEHLYYPGKLIDAAYNLLNPGGYLILSTPYHGYLKNLILAASGKMDAHFQALHDHSHIKFWSHKTLTTLLKTHGFTEVHFSHIGRIYPLATSMFVQARRK